MADFIIHFMEKKNVVMLRVRSTFRFNTSSAELSFPAQSFTRNFSDTYGHSLLPQRALRVLSMKKNRKKWTKGKKRHTGPKTTHTGLQIGLSSYFNLVVKEKKKVPI